MARDRVTKRIVVMDESGEDAASRYDALESSVRGDLTRVADSVDSLTSSFSKFAEMMQSVVNSLDVVEKGAEAHARKARDASAVSRNAMRVAVDAAEDADTSAVVALASTVGEDDGGFETDNEQWLKDAGFNDDTIQKLKQRGYLKRVGKGNTGAYVKTQDEILGAAGFIKRQTQASNIIDAANSLNSVARSTIVEPNVSKTTNTVASMLAPVAPEAAAVVKLVGEAYDAVAGIADTVTDINKMGQRTTNLTGTRDIGQEISAKWQAELGRFDLRASKQDFQTIQAALRGARADYGSSLYSEGLEFSLDAMQDYGLSAQTASSMFVNSVIKGGASAEALSGSLDLLMKSVKEGEQTMDDAIKQMEEWTRGLSKLGGSAEYQQGIGKGILGALNEAEVGEATYAMVTKAVGQWGGDYQFQSDVNKYMATGDTYEEALIAASRDWIEMTNLGYESAGAGYAVLHEVMDNGRTIAEMIDAGDIDAAYKYAQSDARIRQAVVDYAGAYGISGDGTNKSLEGIISGLSEARTGIASAGEQYGSISNDGRYGSISVNGVDIRITTDDGIFIEKMQRAADQRNADGRTA